ncbi:SusD/RagB family nutrient-binding outer membrane lipoprotein [Fodinibius halophilus]|uniref:SusD/RagB family nutrient-binding outer membrane lipoprotein n=1 Tax=Fodinibius halophilus TaxID=1736908 RepID=A0A6M1TJ45_9BACT|nr:SusD/RagB family nutrient-binding outer membrane lipoprotein [Fodinibius halophilus]NGP90072.1 SusD/RagB family nutrient-binding outer membrane lipoprotein [Fodinibius halophilus]
MKLLYRILTVALVCFVAVSCDVVDQDLLENPNSPSPSNVNPDYLLNNIQLETENVFGEASNFGQELSRMGYMFGDIYRNAYSPSNFNTLYNDAYSDLFIDVKNLTPIAEEKNLYFHLGMAKTLKAYAMLTLVDGFGSIPYSEALDASNLNPKLDDGKAIYDSALVLLDDAIADLKNEDRRGFPENDLYYGDKEGDDKVNAWVKAAKTMKLKAYLNTGNTSEFNALVSEGDIILTPENNFTFNFSTNDANPDSRHPGYITNYAGSPQTYMSVNYMNFLLNDKSASINMDPRMRYYFYRQTTSDPTDVTKNTCITAPKPSHFNTDDPWCLLGDGWWGRDHMIDDGIPPDNELRTTYGVYPVGGAFDDGSGGSTDATMGLKGAGFRPILMAAYTHFLIAEGELTLNNDPGAAETEYLAGAEQSLETVRDFGASVTGGSGFAMTQSDINNYLSIIEGRWDNNPSERLRLNSKEFYLALWTNGIEAYNMMRRTGYPNREDNLQPAREKQPGNWYRTFWYPSDLTKQNNSVDQKNSTLDRTFWDTDGSADAFNF